MVPYVGSLLALLGERVSCLSAEKAVLWVLFAVAVSVAVVTLRLLGPVVL